MNTLSFKSSGIIAIFIFIIALSFSTFGLFAQLKSPSMSNPVEKAAADMAESIARRLKRQPLPNDAKIAVVMFPFDNNFADTIKTHLGINFSKQFSHALKLALQDKNKNYNVLIPNDIDKRLNETMNSYFTLPKGVNEADFWSNFLNNQRPNFYITGKYKISGDYDALTISNVKIQPDQFDPDYAKLSPIAFDNIILPLIKPEDKEFIKNLNKTIHRFSNPIESFIKNSGKANFFQFDIINADNNEALQASDPLAIGQSYQIKVQLITDAYLYAFYYDQQNKLAYPYFEMIFPYQPAMSNYVKQGEQLLPAAEYTFEVGPPASGQVFIKIIATKKHIPIKFDYVTTNNVTTTAFKESDCSEFMSNLGSLDPAQYDAKAIVKIVQQTQP